MPQRLPFGSQSAFERRSAAVNIARENLESAQTALSQQQRAVDELLEAHRGIPEEDIVGLREARQDLKRCEQEVERCEASLNAAQSILNNTFE